MIVTEITIINNVRLAYQTLIYDAMKSFSSWVKSGSLSTLLFINGAKNIIPTIAESIACGEMLFC